jgi:hypothetical protein
LPVVNQITVGPSVPPMITASLSMEPEGHVVHANAIRHMTMIAVTTLMSAKTFFITLRSFKVVLGGGLEPPCLAAHAPQTCVSAIPPPERRNGGTVTDSMAERQGETAGLIFLVFQGTEPETEVPSNICTLIRPCKRVHCVRFVKENRDETAIPCVVRTVRRG